MNSEFPNDTLQKTSGRFSARRKSSSHIDNSNILSQPTQMPQDSTRDSVHIQVLAACDDHTFPET